MPRSKTPIVCFGALLPAWVAAQAVPSADRVLAQANAPEIEVIGHVGNGLGNHDAASQGVIGAEALRERTLPRPAQVLEIIPGMVVTQHSGDGKANQYFLRGVNLDHGTDFATTVNGVPVNMPTHAHGQGYSDLNFLIPELVQRIEYKKGPYFASEGDFASAGSAHFIYRRQLERPVLDVTLGQQGYRRALAAGSHQLGSGQTLLAAVEQTRNNGPWTTPEGLLKNNALLTLSDGNAQQHWQATLSSYTARWTATDQVPQRLINAGSYQGQPFGRFDSLDPTDGGQTRRTSLSAQWQSHDDGVRSRIGAYVLQYGLDLYSNFTYFLDPQRRQGDQFGQRDQRTTWGGNASRTWLCEQSCPVSMSNTLGMQWRQDRIRVGLFNTSARSIESTVRDDQVQQSLASVYAENSSQWTPWLRTVVGARVDQLSAQVTGLSPVSENASAQSGQLSPKWSAVLGPWGKTVIFFNAGQGFHSNDARGATARVDPAPGLVRTRGHEIGIQTEAIAQLQSSLTLWQLDFDSELVYVGDAGTTEPGRPSHRVGIEWSNHWQAARHVRLDANLAWTRPRYTDGASTGAFIANAVQHVANLGLVVSAVGPWSGAIHLRYIGSAPLTEDNLLRSAPSATLQLHLQRQLSQQLALTLDVLNLTQRQNSDITYAYTSRLAGEPVGGVNDVHLHPAQPRSLRLGLHWRL